ncbi:MAG: cyclic nucleotide-binding domain-containing protein [Deltaproteobacteria bacterium]|nr:cyclic nucleotide-binding domain-containing protein [Deltaproteobacteria bacterium]
MSSDVISKVPLFSGLGRNHIDAISKICKAEEHAAGEILFAEGSAGDKLFIIEKGEVRISQKLQGMGEEALAVLKPGSYFGEMALIDDSPRSADAISHTSVSLITIARDDLEELLFVNRDLAYAVLWNFCRTLSKRLRETNEKVKGFLAMAKWV